MHILEAAAGRMVLLSVLFPFACAAAAPAESLGPARFLPIAASVVRVEAQRAQGGLSVGSGVTVAPGVVATSCHVVREAIAVRVAGQGGSWDVDAERADSRRDVCFLRVPSWPGRAVALAPADGLAAGDLLVALGFTAGAAITPRFGSVRALHPFDGGDVIESDTSFNSGSSGGGLFNGGGELVGLLTFRLRDSRENYYSVPVRWIHEGLAKETAWSPVQPLAGEAPFWQGDGEQLPGFMREAALASRFAHGTSSNGPRLPSEQP